MIAEGSIGVKKLDRDARLIEKANRGDLGYDIFANENVAISPGKSELVDTGVALQPPEEWGLFIKDRSSYASSKNLETAAGVIDQGYRGEVKVLIRNHENRLHRVLRGDKIAQLVPIPVTNFDAKEVNEFGQTERGADGFGSTGEK